MVGIPLGEGHAAAVCATSGHGLWYRGVVVNGRACNGVDLHDVRFNEILSWAVQQLVDLLLPLFAARSR